MKDILRKEKPGPFEARPLSTDISKPRILFIDDSRLIRAAVIKMFSDIYDVVLAEDGFEGWQRIEDDRSIQMVFTDLVMPEMDGFEVLSRIRTSSDETISQLPVIVVTGADNRDDAKAKAFTLGATDFLAKPFDATDINACAQTHTRHRKTTQKLQAQSIVDMLTGLLNRRGFRKQLEKDISFVARHSHRFTVLEIEIDAFKELFMRIGRNGAEAIIRKVGDVIVGAVRKEDTVARTGLACFRVSLPAADPSSSLLIAHRICQIVSNLKAKYQGKLLPLSVSAGACIVEQGVLAEVDVILDVVKEAKDCAVARGLSQVHSVDLGRYHDKRKRGTDALSIDDVLHEIESGGSKDVVTQMEFILDELSPLFALMSEEQKERLLARPR